MTEGWADRVAAGAREFWRRRVRFIDGAESAQIDGLLVAATKLDEDPNAAFVEREPEDPARALAEAEAWIRERGWPLGLELEDGCHPAVEAAAAAAGFEPLMRRPAMVLWLSDLRPSRLPDGVEIRAARPEDISALRAIETACFGTSATIAERFIPPALLETPGLSTFVALSDGAAVASAVASRHEETVGIFGVATVPEARGRGIGTAMTAHAAASARGEAEFAWLNPTEGARGLYERMGFRVSSEWSIWLRE